MKLTFEHDYQKKYMIVRFEEGSSLQSEDDVLQIRQQWMQALGSWHSPYKAVIDAQQLQLASDDPASLEAIAAAWKRTMKLLEGFFLKNAIAWGIPDDRLTTILPFKVVETEAEAFDSLNIRLQAQSKQASNFRDLIQFQNHFRQQSVELSFSEPADIDNAEKMQALRSKLTNNLMQWHSPWNLMIDCHNLEIKEELFSSFEGMIQFFRGFFLKDVIGYSPKQKGLRYPFQVYRSRHVAAAKLESEGNFSADEANCSTRKSP